jgi:hypothetical protein
MAEPSARKFAACNRSPSVLKVMMFPVDEMKRSTSVIGGI